MRRIVADAPIERYVGNLLLESATERQMEIVGEALRNIRRVDEDLVELIPHAHKIIGMRNIFAHGYAKVDSLTVWTAGRRTYQR